jgi:hypothetical protein
MKKKWNDLLTNAGPLVGYLNRVSYFDKAYGGPPARRLILTDVDVAFKYASDDSFESFDEWETVSDSPDLFPENFEWKSWIDHNLLESNYFSLTSKDFNGADTKWTKSGICLLYELMHRDVRILLNCYANNFFPDIWNDILDVYLNDGFPCGWQGTYPQGELVVFSNF